MFTVNGLEMVFRHLTVAGPTHYYIFITPRATLNGFIISDVEDGITSTKKYFIIKRTLFALKKKFITTGNKRRYC